MVCKKCGGKVPEGNKFCIYCGDIFETSDKTMATEENEKKNGEKAGIIDRLKQKTNFGAAEKKMGKKFAIILVSVIAALVLFSILISAVNTSSSNDEYVVFEKEDELVIYKNDKEIMALDYEGPYSLIIKDEKFALADQSGDDGANALYVGKVKKKAKVQEVSDSVAYYDFSENTIAYIEIDDDEQILYVGEFSKIDEAEEIDDDVIDVRVSGDGKAVYYSNNDNNVYVFKNGDSDKIAKDASIALVGQDGNQAILIEDIDDEDQTLVWYKNGDDFELTDSYGGVWYTDSEKLEMVFIGNWDNEDGNGTLYYASKYGKDPMEIDKDVAELSLDSYYTTDTDYDPKYIFYTKDDDTYISEIGKQGEGEKFMSQDDDFNIIAYDEKYNVLLWYEDADEVQYLKLKTNEEGSIKLKDDLVRIEYADDVIVYENEGKEVMHVGSEGETEILNDMHWNLIDARYIFAATGDEKENQSYIYDMKKGKEVLLAEDLQDFRILDDTVYALGNYDVKDEEGTVYRLEFGKDKPIKMDDGVRQILIVKNW